MPDQAKPSVTREDLLQMVTDIVTSYVRATKVASEQLPDIIQQVYRSLERPEPATATPLQPAVPIRRSVTPEYLICLEDGRQLKMLKRHLMTAYGMTPAEYRARWGLPNDYPMVAPNYAKHRSALAKESGLGRRSAAEPARTKAASRRPRRSAGRGGRAAKAR
jgi:predicted transcriptional regulator